MKLLKIFYAFIFVVMLSGCASISSNKQNTLQENMKKYKDDDLILAMSVSTHNIANPQYNYELAVFGNGEILRKGGVYKRDYPTKASKEILDSIVSMGLEISSYNYTPRPFMQDGPSRSLTVYGHPGPIDRSLENEGVTKLLNYVDSVIILPVN